MASRTQPMFSDSNCVPAVGVAVAVVFSGKGSLAVSVAVFSGDCFLAVSGTAFSGIGCSLVVRLTVAVLSGHGCFLVVKVDAISGNRCFLVVGFVVSSLVELVVSSCICCCLAEFHKGDRINSKGGIGAIVCILPVLHGVDLDLLVLQWILS